MTEIESEYISLKETPEKVFAFLKVISNHRLLMPSQVSDWWNDEQEAKLKIQGLGTLHLTIGTAEPFQRVRIVPASKAPVDLFLEWNIQPEGDQSRARVAIHADLNMMMRLVATKPLQNLADFMAKSLPSALQKTV